MYLTKAFGAHSVRLSHLSQRHQVSALLARTTLRTDCWGTRSAHSGQDSLPTPPAIAVLETAAQNAEARSWIEKFKAREIPKGAVEFTYSRSSGPGGQVCGYIMPASFRL